MARLIDVTTGKEIKLGDVVTTLRGDHYTLAAFDRKLQGQYGSVTLQKTLILPPKAINAQVVED